MFTSCLYLFFCSSFDVSVFLYLLGGSHNHVCVFDVFRQFPERESIDTWNRFSDFIRDLVRLDWMNRVRYSSVPESCGGGLARRSRPGGAVMVGEVQTVIFNARFPTAADAGRAAVEEEPREFQLQQ